MSKLSEKLRAKYWADVITASDHDVLELVDEHEELEAQFKRSEGERDVLLRAAKCAIEAAKDENIDRYRGTDDEREFMGYLRRAIEAVE